LGNKDPYRPHRQGSLDGLCGIYAIINALRTASGVEADADELFATACNALAKSRWPEVLWVGTGIGDMRNMVAASIAKHGDGQLRARYPFLRNKPSSNAEFWYKLEDAFAEHDATCAVIGLDKPHKHWLAIGLDGGRVQILDSDGPSRYDRKNRASIHAGLRRKKPDQWLVSRTDVALFCRVPQT